MFWVRLVPEGMEILNQHCTVKALLVGFQLNPPVGSDTASLALPGNVPAMDCKANRTNANHPDSTKYSLTGRAKFQVMCLNARMLASSSHLLDVVAADDTQCSPLTQQHHFRTNASALHLEGYAVLGFHAGLFGPFFCLCREKGSEQPE